MGAEAVNLDLSIPFSAARARNEGFKRLMQIAPQTRFAHFVDGDCEIVEGWIPAARQFLEFTERAAVVCGRRRERHPDHSVYNRMADLEWDAPVGEVRSCGGDALFRVDAFQKAGGFDATVVAGEEPELCQRLREAGWTIHRIANEMTSHDAATLRFGQWWKRQVRSGYGAADVVARFRRGKDGLFVRQTQSAMFWAAWPLVVALGFLFGWMARITYTGDVNNLDGWMWGLIVVIPLVGVWLLQVLRIARGQMRREVPTRDALAYGLLTMIGKWAMYRGMSQYRRDRRKGKLTRLIDYKATPAHA